MTKVKICGITNAEDALVAVKAGVDALGFIFYEHSPRYVTPDMVKAITNGLPPFVTTVGVFVNVPVPQIHEVVQSCGLHAVQLHGDEPPEYCDQIEHAVIKAVRVKDASFQTDIAPYRVHAVLLDTYAPDKYGGTGSTFDWALIKQISHRFILSGGLTSKNVSEAIRQVRPYAVDTGSGVEASPGRKDHDKIRAFIKAVRQIDR
jgi:phosphoribosylanthranilate isomerase